MTIVLRPEADEQQVVLQPLTLQDAGTFYAIYSNPGIADFFDESPFLQGETSQQFTERIIHLCEQIYTIRPANNADLIIGDCALHHWDRVSRVVSIGGALLPEYWGMGYMKAAFWQLIKIAKKNLGAQELVGQTKTRNTSAIRLAEKMGFKVSWSDGQDTIVSRKI